MLQIRNNSIDREWYSYEVFVKSMLKNIKKVKRDRLLKKNLENVTYETQHIWLDILRIL